MDEFLKAILTVLNQHGPAAGLVGILMGVNGFFIWCCYKRELRMQSEIDVLHRNQQEVLIPLLEECKESISSCKEVITQNSQLIRELASGRQ